MKTNDEHPNNNDKDLTPEEETAIVAVAGCFTFCLCFIFLVIIGAVVSVLK